MVSRYLPRYEVQGGYEIKADFVTASGGGGPSVYVPRYRTSKVHLFITNRVDTPARTIDASQTFPTSRIDEPHSQFSFNKDSLCLDFRPPIQPTINFTCILVPAFLLNVGRLLGRRGLGALAVLLPAAGELPKFWTF